MEEQNPKPRYKTILGSASIARKKIFADMYSVYEYLVMTADIDEKAIRKEKPEELVIALAEAKAEAIMLQLKSIYNQERADACDARRELLVTADTAEVSTPKPPTGEFQVDNTTTLLVTCDQVVIYEGTIREKPSSEDEARQFLQSYSGGCCATVSSVVVTNLKTGFQKGDLDKVEIHFHDIPEDVIESLIKEGNVLYVAGALIIEHPLIVPYVKEVVGTTDSVMGLPIALTERLMNEVYSGICSS